MNLGETYDLLFVKLADKRCYDWLLMSGPIYPIAIILGYLYLVYDYFPKFMKGRKAYNLKTLIQVYNITQVVFCLMLMYGMMTNGWTTHLTIYCEPVDYSDDPMALNLLRYYWWAIWLKLYEFLETFIFALRKKDNQITKLHVYHHASTFFATWLATKYIGGGMTTFSIILNSGVHVIMYVYYFLSSLGPNIQKRLAFIKPKLTTLQMVQFCIIIVHSSQVLREDCKMAIVAPLMFIPNVVVIFAFFINFYINKYLGNAAKKDRNLRQH